MPRIITELESAFYKLTEDDFLLDGLRVVSKDYVLTVDTKDSFTYPHDGWYWFETRAEAKTFFGIE